MGAGLKLVRFEREGTCALSREVEGGSPDGVARVLGSQGKGDPELNQP